MPNESLSIHCMINRGKKYQFWHFHMIAREHRSLSDILHDPNVTVESKKRKPMPLSVSKM